MIGRSAYPGVLQSGDRIQQGGHDWQRSGFRPASAGVGCHAG